MEGLGRIFRKYIRTVFRISEIVEEKYSPGREKVFAVVRMAPHSSWLIPVF